jgi:hypothetical protein
LSDTDPGEAAKEAGRSIEAGAKSAAAGAKAGAERAKEEAKKKAQHGSNVLSILRNTARAAVAAAIVKRVSDVVRRLT